MENLLYHQWYDDPRTKKFIEMIEKMHASAKHHLETTALIGTFNQEQLYAIYRLQGEYKLLSFLKDEDAVCKKLINAENSEKVRQLAERGDV